MLKERAYTAKQLLPFAKAAHKSLLNQAEDARVDPKIADLEDMYRADAKDYETIVLLLEQNDLKGAMRAWRLLDTASRDNMGDGRGDFSLERFQANIDES